jgi:hypothetical protein
MLGEIMRCSSKLDTSTSTPSAGVSFGTVRVRWHSRILGDHPVCKDGLPLALGWEIIGDPDTMFDLDEYEQKERVGKEFRSRKDLPLEDQTLESADTHTSASRDGLLTSTGCSSLSLGHRNVLHAKRLSYEEREKVLQQAGVDTRNAQLVFLRRRRRDIVEAAIIEIERIQQEQLARKAEAEKRKGRNSSERGIPLLKRLSNNSMSDGSDDEEDDPASDLQIRRSKASSHPCLKGSEALLNVLSFFFPRRGPTFEDGTAAFHEEQWWEIGE